MDKVQIVTVSSKRDIKDFVKLPYQIYKNDPWWVPPLESDIKKLLQPDYNPLLKKGKYKFLLARDRGKIKARMGVGIDRTINKRKDRKEGYLTLFESYPDYSITKRILDYALKWLKDCGMETVTGPISPTRGDDYRGMLIKGFGSSPVLLNPYNPVYYPEFFDRYGFKKDMDFCAYFYDLKKKIDPKYQRAVKLARKRYGFEVFPFNMDNTEQELEDIKQIIDEALPADWPHLIPPELDELKSIAGRLLKLAEPGLINIARYHERPVGFALAMPDYNQVLKKINGKLFPFGFFKFLINKRRISGGRFFVMFVVPDFHKKGVSAAIYLKTFTAAKELGYTYAEGSQIGEWNNAMRRDAEGVGGRLYKKYRIYRKTL